MEFLVLMKFAITVIKLDAHLIVFLIRGMFVPQNQVKNQLADRFVETESKLRMKSAIMEKRQVVELVILLIPDLPVRKIAHLNQHVQQYVEMKLKHQHNSVIMAVDLVAARIAFWIQAMYQLEVCPLLYVEIISRLVLKVAIMVKEKVALIVQLLLIIIVNKSKLQVLHSAL